MAVEPNRSLAAIVERDQRSGPGVDAVTEPWRSRLAPIGDELGGKLDPCDLRHPDSIWLRECRPRTAGDRRALVALRGTGDLRADPHAVDESDPGIRPVAVVNAPGRQRPPPRARARGGPEEACGGSTPLHVGGTYDPGQQPNGAGGPGPRHQSKRRDAGQAAIGYRLSEAEVKAFYKALLDGRRGWAPDGSLVGIMWSDEIDACTWHNEGLTFRLGLQYMQGWRELRAPDRGWPTVYSIQVWDGASEETETTACLTAQ